ncbi:MAG TPA: beta-galactosidase [Candidatus Saccharimonadales bacterium]|nr:beta-galactosidase [Candidatus Saccharimonadales bacterium]
MTKLSRLHSLELTKSLVKWPLKYWRQNLWHKIISIALIIAILTTGTMYGIAQWYIWSVRNQPLELGVSFIPDYAQYLGLEPQTTMDALLHIGVRHLRLVSYWSDMEASPGQYDFSQLDWQFQKAEATGAKVSLSIGLRQPRWPECHAPTWVDLSQSASKWQPQLENFMTAVIKRYQASPSLESYQLENEYFLKQYGFFGACTNFSRDRLISEYNLVKKLDSRHPLIIARSNNDLGIPLGDPKPDLYGVSIYKRVWDESLHTHRYLEYPFPAWYYSFLAGVQKIHDGREMIVHEMQAEAWPPRGQPIPETPLAEQNKSINAKRLKDRFKYARATGMRQVYMWGAEYWYYRMQILHDPSLWQAAQQEFENTK